MAFRGDLEGLVLGALEEAPLHGYAIARLLDERSGGVLHYSEGQLYPALHALEKEGLIAADWVPQLGRPARKVYKMLDPGHAALKKKRNDWKLFVKAVQRVLER